LFKNLGGSRRQSARVAAVQSGARGPDRADRRGDARRPGTADRTSAGRPGRDDPTAWSSMPLSP